MNTESGGPIEIRISKWSAGLGGPLVVRAPNCPGGTPPLSRVRTQAAGESGVGSQPARAGVSRRRARTPHRQSETASGSR